MNVFNFHYSHTVAQANNHVPITREGMVPNDPSDMLRTRKKPQNLLFRAMIAHNTIF
jgi:hypothetical protein